MAFPPGFLDELRSRTSLADLIGRRVRLTRKGREYGGLCPFHNEKTPSFYVVEDKGFFHCFGCGAHGDAIGFVMRDGNLDFIEAVERLAAEAGLGVPAQTPQERERASRQKTLLEALAAASQFFATQLNSPAGAAARDYLHRRGLDDETVRRFRLGFVPDRRQALRAALGPEFPEALLVEAGLLRRPADGREAYDYFRGRIIFPIADRAGRPIAFGGRTLDAAADVQPKYLNSPDTPVFDKGRVLYGWSEARAHIARAADSPAAGVVVVEGYMDVIALHRAGFGGAVGTLGTALTEAHLGELWRLSPEPVICFDGDAAGRRAALRAMERALPLLQPGRSLAFATLPAGEDPDSLIRGGGPAAVAAVLKAAQPLSEVLWQRELQARPVDTPERRADLERRVMAQAALIADRSVQAEYRRFLRERLFATAHAGRPRPRGAPRPAPARPDFAPDFAPPRPPGRGSRELFLAIFIAHPALIEEWIEEIAALEVPEPELDRLRRAILEVCHASPGLDAKALQQHLALCGHAELIANLAGTVARHAGFAARGGDDPEVIRLGLTETLQLLRARQPAGRDAAHAPRTDASDEDLRRLYALRERKLQDGPVGGFE